MTTLWQSFNLYVRKQRTDETLTSTIFIFNYLPQIVEQNACDLVWNLQEYV